PNCIQFIHASNPGWHFAYNPAPNQRKIYYVRDGHDSSDTGSPVPAIPAATSVKAQDAVNNPGQTGGYGTAIAGIVGTVGAGGGSGSEYNLIRGFSRHEETDNETNDTSTVFYYSDAFFDSDPVSYNVHLATASLNLAYAGMYLRSKEPADDKGNYYYNRHAAGRQFLADIGCPDNNIYVNDSNVSKPQTDSIGVTIGSKELEKADGTKTGKILIPVVVRGGGYELEWASNATLGSASATASRGDEAKGFSSAADDVMGEIDSYIKFYGLEDALSSGNVKFWVTGYSRAGAVANITSKRLIEKYADGTSGKNNQVFGYTCEAPMGGTDTAQKLSGDKYYSIHNLINAVDIVPLVAPQLMGFKRYGVDHYIPGTTAGSVSTTVIDCSKRSGGGPSTVTTYRDNDYIKMKDASSSLKNGMATQLRAVDPSIIVDDYFHPMEIELLTSQEIAEVGDYDGNHVESFVRDFIRFVQEGNAPYAVGRNQETQHSQAAPDRAYYASNLEPAICDLLAMVFTMESDTSTGFIDRAASIMNLIPTANLTGLSKIELLTDYLGAWASNTITDKTRQSKMTQLWTKFEQTGALDFLSSSDKAKMQRHWPQLCDMVLTLVSADDKYYPGKEDGGHGWAKGTHSSLATETMLLTATFAAHSTYILQNHYPEVNLAWARSYDNYYQNETTEYDISTGSSAMIEYHVVYRPQATANDDQVLTEGQDKSNILQGDQRIILDSTNLVGEAIYYDLTDNKTGEVLESNKIYRGGIDLPLGNDAGRSYTIKTHAISYNVYSRDAFYNINLVNNKHVVALSDGSTDWPVEYAFDEGASVTVTASPEDGKYFKKWTVELLDDSGRQVAEDISEQLMGTSAGRIRSTFVMPEAGTYINGTDGERYPAGYSLIVTAVFGSRIKIIEASPALPAAGQTLAAEVTVTFDNDKTGTYPVSWFYESDDSESDVPDANDSEADPTDPAEPSEAPQQPETPEPSADDITDQEDHSVVPEPSEEPQQPESSDPSDAAEPAGHEEASGQQDTSEQTDSKGDLVSGKMQTEPTDDKTFGTKVVPASGKAYNNTVYYASVTIPEDEANDIIFAPRVSGRSYSGTVVSCTRNDADGSATIVIRFEKTDDGGSERPDADIKLSVNVFDLNLNDYDTFAGVKYHVYQNAVVTLTAPDVSDEVFMNWDLEGSGIILKNGYKVTDRTIQVQIPNGLTANELAIDANYIPVITKINAQVEAPSGGQPMQGSASDDTLRVTITNEYEIDPDYVSINWSPSPSDGNADYMTNYTVTISIVPHEDEDGKYVMARRVGDTQ
ncbi:MAG: hypothetical protein IKH76_01320, partial [Clostridiales bacterium]|nr:hypothetical protein [Clostridiales bacterium]